MGSPDDAEDSAHLGPSGRGLKRRRSQEKEEEESGGGEEEETNSQG